MEHCVHFVRTVADADTDTDLLDMLLSCEVDEYSLGYFLKLITLYKRKVQSFLPFFFPQDNGNNCFYSKPVDQLISFVNSLKTFQTTRILSGMSATHCWECYLFQLLGSLAVPSLWTWEIFRAWAMLICHSETVPAPAFSPSFAPLSSRASTQLL